MRMENKKMKLLNIRRILNAFKHSYDGFIAAFKSEIAFKQDLVVFVIFTTLAAILDIPTLHKIALFSSLLFILFAELVNTAIETTINRISTEYHELSKKAKDIGSMLVLLSFINAIIWWLGILFINYIQ